jgi:hypothetical protein
MRAHLGDERRGIERGGTLGGNSDGFNQNVGDVYQYDKYDEKVMRKASHDNQKKNVIQAIVLFAVRAIPWKRFGLV